MQGWTRWIPLLAPAVRLFVSCYWRLGPGLTAFLPDRVRALLAAPFLRASLIRMVRTVAADPHQPHHERREQAREIVGAHLRTLELGLSDPDLALLIELLDGWVRRHPDRGVPPARTRAESQL